MRGASPSAVAQITDMNERIDVRHVLPTIRVPTLVLYRAQEYLREANRYMGARIPGARVVELPGADHLPWEGDQDTVLDEIAGFLGEAHAEQEPNLVLTTVLEAELTDAGRPAMRGALSPLPRPRARCAGRAACRASFDGPARALRCAVALQDAGAGPAGVHTGECELAGGRLRGAALEIASGLAAAARPGEVLASSTVHDLVAGSGVRFAERGAVAVPLDGRLREWRVFAVAR